MMMLLAIHCVMELSYNIHMSAGRSFFVPTRSIEQFMFQLPTTTL